MKKIYEHNQLNKNWYNIWEKNNTFSPDYKKNKTYCITIPPPNITGKLHMGHAFQCTLMDILIRYYRMNQYSTLWKMGTDHAGIATQILIEQKLKNSKNKNFQKYSKKWKKKSIKNIKTQLKTQGCSVNWKTERFTLDKHFSYAVKIAFIKLYKEKLIYKNKSLVNWDPKLKTAISDLETIYKEENTKLYHIKYKISDTNNNYISIATTRPETIFADVAVAINPNDKRYNYLINKKLYIPIINKKIPIILDDNVDINFGTGCLKITPAHDFKDFEIGKKHKLPIINILTKDGNLNENVPFKYQNLNIKNARNLIENDLKKNNLIEKITTYKNKIPVGDRSNNIIEPFLTEQWYIKTKPLIIPVEQAIREKKIKIIPTKWEKVFFNWIDNIKDWCISRQIWWGHRIPIWYDKDKNTYVGENEKKIRNVYKIDNNIILKQETDVLDTWFSSALWPFASLGWPNDTKEFKKFYPTNTLITGFDIIFFWAIKMMMFGIKFTNILPFKEIYIHGLIRDNHGNKMSKTKGNVLDPSDIINGISYTDLIKKQTSHLINDKQKTQIIYNTTKQFPKGIESFGVDALRLTLTSLATDNASINLNLANIKKYKNFCNKIWNAGKFIKTNIKYNNNANYKKLLPSLWIISIWQKIKKDIIFNINKRNFSQVNELIYKFTWNEFCDWYIEIIKIIIENEKYKKYTITYTINIFNEILKTLHPIAPYITEEIWHIINSNTKENLITSKYPTINNNLTNKKSEKLIMLLKIITTNIRNIKFKIKDENINSIYISINIKTFKDLTRLEQIKSILLKLAKIKKIYIQKNDKNILNIKISKNIICFIHLQKNIYTKKTNEKNIKKINDKINMLKKTLNNKNFINNASHEIINSKKNKLKELLNLK